MIITRESYRDLIVRYPHYKAFSLQIFMNYLLLIVGFGMSGPDFETIMQSFFSTLWLSSISIYTNYDVIFLINIFAHLSSHYEKLKNPNCIFYRIWGYS